MSTNPLDLTKEREDKLVEVIHVMTISSGVIAIAGFIFIYALIDKLLNNGMKPGSIAVFMIFSLAVVFGISSLLIRQLSRVLSTFLRKNKSETLHQIDELVIPQLDAPREPLSSVTEHTTRAFEPLSREPNR